MKKMTHEEARIFSEDVEVRDIVADWCLHNIGDETLLDLLKVEVNHFHGRQRQKAYEANKALETQMGFYFQGAD